jgi:hypothetical protein
VHGWESTGRGYLGNPRGADVYAFHPGAIVADGFGPFTVTEPAGCGG